MGRYEPATHSSRRQNEFGILLAAWGIDSRLAVSWALGLAVGVVLQRGRACFADAFRDLHLKRNGGMLRAVLLGLAVCDPSSL